MADSKISGLPAATVAAGSDELAANEAGTSKKVTVEQLRGGRTFFIAPEGDDSTGDGTELKPWKGIKKLCAALTQPGDTGYCRGGTYVEAAAFGDNVIDAEGTTGAPITIRNYPGEVPVFDGSSAGTYTHPLWFRYAKHWVVDGLQFTGWTPTQAADIVLGAGAGGGLYCADITVQNCKLTAKAGLSNNEHLVYASNHAQTAATVRWCTLVGMNSGSGHGRRP
ncbi:MAG: hypothetical protein U0838_13110 [Chloroflexota bacterium]